MNMQGDYTRYGAYGGYGPGGYGPGGYSSGGYARGGILVLPKESWAGASMDRAFSEDTPWVYKRQGQIKFFQAIQNLRKALQKSDLGFAFKDKGEGAQPQLSAFYTPFPWPARAALGHTIYMETERLTHEVYKAIAERITDLDTAARRGKHKVVYQMVCQHVAMTLSHRAILADLARSPELRCVEMYRLFQVSQSSLRFQNLNDVIGHAVLFGDVLPDQGEMRLHPMTAQILRWLSAISTEYAGLDGVSDGDAALAAYVSWGRKIMSALLPVLPDEPVPRATDHPAEASPMNPVFRKRLLDEYKYGPGPTQENASSDDIPPLGEPQAPALAEPASPMDLLKKLMESEQSGSRLPGTQDNASPVRFDGAAPDKDMVKAFDDLSKTASKASGQTEKWEDTREDLIGIEIERKPFARGPVEGQPTSGTNITCELGGEEVGGDLMDRPIGLSENEIEVRKLREEAFPIASALRKNLYPSMMDEFLLEFPRASGQLDPRRLPVAAFSESVYRQTRVRTQRDPAGKAVILIAADGSSSLTDPQMRMCKLLAAGWLESIGNRQIELVAALYNSGTIGNRGRMPLVQWMYHPKKTSAFSHREAIRAVAALPDSGQGCQSDALSLKYLLDEAHAVARGSQTYLILISDCAWNKSFPAAKCSPEEEVTEVLAKARDQFKKQLHATLVALKPVVSEEMRAALDTVMMIEPKDLQNAAEAAQVIGSYVAKCIGERREMT